MVADATRSGRVASLIATVARVLQIDAADVDPARPLFELGLGSVHAVRLAAELAAELARPVPPTLLFEHPTIAALVAHLDGDLAPAVAPAVAGGAEPIAIVGMACRFPQAPDLDAFWRLLADGVDATGPVPHDRWDGAAWHDPDPAAPGKSITDRAAFLADVRGFEPLFFGVSPREADELDPQQRLALELAWEALEDAGVPPRALAGTPAAVFFGAMWHDWADRTHADVAGMSAHRATGTANNLIANRVSYALGLRGPSLVVDTACSSALVALHLAVHALVNGDTDLALVGAVNLLLAPESMVFCSKFGGLAPDGRCKTFDARADGFGRGEGGGVVVLKRLSRARADGDRVWAVVRGTAVNNNGAGQGLTAPGPRAQIDVLRAALARAGLAGRDIHVVEAHGTGTLLGDPIEAAALGAVLGDGRPEGRPLLVGSVKTNIGHTEGAAGIAGLVKTVLALHHRRVPASLHLHRPSPHIDFAALRLRVPTELTAWPAAPDVPGLAGVSAFGWGGTNAHVVLAADPPAPHFFPLAADDDAALDAALRDLDAACARDPWPPPLPAPRGRLRLALVARTPDELRLRIAAALARRASDGLELPAAPPARVVFVCSPLGSQWPGMARALLDDPVFAAAIDRCDRALAPRLGRSIRDDLRADWHDIADVVRVQPLLFAVQVALADVLRAWGVRPDVVLGHSAGEIAAAHIAGALDLEQAADVVAHYARVQRPNAGRGAMAVVALAPALLRPRLSDALALAADNGPASSVVSGDALALADLLAALRAEGVTCSQIHTDVAGHSPLVRDGLPELARSLADLRPTPPTTPWISTVTAAREDRPDGAYWARNLGEPVRFREAVTPLLADALCIELGPHPVLAHAIRECAAHLADDPRTAHAEPSIASPTAAYAELASHAETRTAHADLDPRLASHAEPRIASHTADRPAALTEHRDEAPRTAHAEPRTAHAEPRPSRIDLASHAESRTAHDDPRTAHAEPRPSRIDLDPHTSVAPRAARVVATLRRGHDDRLALHAARAALFAAGLADDPPRPPPELLVLSARSAAGLAESAARLADRLTRDPPALRDLAHTAGARRSHHEHRLAVVGDSAADLAAALRRDGARGRRRVRPRLVFVFPGQGSQWPGMARRLFADEPVFRDRLRECDRALAPVFGSAIAELHAAAPRFDRNDVVQPVLWAVGLALAAQWRAWGLAPDAVVGHSMGEITAACCAGALPLADGARLIATRSRIARTRAGGAMAVVELALPDALAAVDPVSDRLVVGAHNGPRECVLSGDPDALARVLADLGARGVFTRRVKVDYASHGPDMDGLREPLRAALADLSPRPGDIPLLSTVTADWHPGEHLDADYWATNLRARVRFADAIDRLLAPAEPWRDDPRVFLEVSPHPVLLAAIHDTLRAHDPAADHRALASLRRDEDERACLLAAAGALFTAGVDLDLAAIRPAGGRVVSLPPIAWQRTPHWHRAAAPPRPRAGHPLLGEPFTTPALPGAHCFAGRLGPDAPTYLADHRVGDAIVAPAALWIDLILAAAASAHGPRPRALVDATFHEALIVPPAGADVQIVLTAAPDGPTFTAYGRAAETWTTHATGRLRDLQPVPADRQTIHTPVPADSLLAPPVLADTPHTPVPTNSLLVPLPPARADAMHTPVPADSLLAPHTPARADSPASGISTPVPGDSFYAALARRGLAYGPAFRAVRHVQAADGRVDAELLPGQPTPVLLDAALHALVAALPDDGRALVPVGLRELRAHAPLAAAARVTGRVHRTADPTADLEIRAADGRLLLELAGLALRPLAGVRVRHDELLAHTWHDLPPAPPPSTPRPRRWLLIPALPHSPAPDLSQSPSTDLSQSTFITVGSDLSQSTFITVGSDPPQVSATNLSQVPASDLSQSTFISVGTDPPHVPATDLPQRTFITVGSDPQDRLPAALAALLTRAGDHAHVLAAHADLPATLAEPWDGVLLISPPPAAAFAWTHALELADAALRVTHALLRRSDRDTPRLWFVTRGATAVDAAPPTLAHAPLHGLGLTLAYEHPELRCARVDLPADPGAAELERLVAELRADTPEDALALRGDRRLAARLVPGAVASADLGPGRTQFLITGGLGDLGLALAERLVASGARTLALVGRSGVTRPDQSAAIDRMRAAGARVDVHRIDVADHDALAAVIADLPDLDAVFHAAGVLDDRLVDSVDRDSLRRVFTPKVAGAWNLHRLTQGRPRCRLVLYSSVASLIGSPGQSNYAAACAVVDALAEHRRALGLPTLAIHWGAVADVGLAARDARRGQRLASRGMLPLALDRAHDLLTTLLADPTLTRVGVAPFDLRQWQESHLAVAAAPLLSALGAAAPQPRADRDALRAALLAATPADRTRRLEAFVRDQVLRVLRVDPARVHRHVRLVELGLDSLTGLELRNLLELGLGLRLPAALAWTHPELARLAADLDARLLADAAATAPPADITTTTTATTPTPAVPDDLAGMSDEDLMATLTAELGLSE